jgi:hypothetical protein
MKSIRDQRGLSMPAILIIVAMLAFFVMCGLKMAPLYFEYLSVKEIVEQVASEYDKETETTSDIRRRLETMFNTNQIYALKARDVEVFRKDGVTYIDSNYEARIPILGRIDAVMKFDDLKLVAGQPVY